MTAGSDAHHESAIGTAYTILNTTISASAGFSTKSRTHRVEPALSQRKRDVQKDLEQPPALAAQAHPSTQLSTAGIRGRTSFAFGVGFVDVLCHYVRRF
jgi:hypothetical protein